MKIGNPCPSCSFQENAISLWRIRGSGPDIEQKQEERKKTTGREEKLLAENIKLSSPDEEKPDSEKREERTAGHTFHRSHIKEGGCHDSGKKRGVGAIVRLAV